MSRLGVASDTVAERVLVIMAVGSAAGAEVVVEELDSVVESGTKGTRTGGSAGSVDLRPVDGRGGGGDNLRGCASGLTRVNRFVFVRDGVNEWFVEVVIRLVAGESVADRVR